MFHVTVAQFEGATTLRVPPLAAGLLVATVRRTADLADVGLRVLAARRPPEVTAAALAEADVAGLSLYTWNTRYALEVARRAKALRPSLVVVAGGPSVPRHSPVREQFLDAHPWVDALVLGEGERAFVDIVRAVRAGDSLTEIAGAVARTGGAITAGPARARLAGDAFAEIGSPYLDGTFDEMVASGEIPVIGAAVLETNRGCPFACTFCDWGQAIHSRVEELPTARVERELSWLAERRVAYLYLVDANFGIRRRDVDITRTIGRLAQERGAPRFVFFHLTKNATATNLRTVEILHQHGVGTQVALSMQDFDAEVLRAIRRDNIRPADALALRERCHAQGLPTINELLLGLPAQTSVSVRRSLVDAITPFPQDSFFLYLTRILDNAELANPAYRARFGIDTRRVPQHPADPAEEPHVVESEEIVVATAAMPIAEWRQALAFGYALSALWNQRLLQTTLHVIRFALGADLAAFVDTLLASERPRLRALRHELLRFADAILDGTGSALPVEGGGGRLREPADAVCARVLESAGEFYAEVSDEAAARVGADEAAVVRDAVAWDELQVLVGASSTTAQFEFDWLAYQAAMGTRPAPIRRPLRVRATPVPAPSEAGARLDQFLALGWSKQPRTRIERLADPPLALPRAAQGDARPLPMVPAPRDPVALRRRASDDGCLYAPRLLPPARLAPLRAVVDAALAARGWVVGGRSDPGLRLGRWDDPRKIEFLAEVMGSPAYGELAAAPEIVGMLRTLFGDPPQLHAGDVCRLVSPAAPELTTPPHQDAAYLTDADGVWTAWLPLGPCPLELGPLSLLPGSHLEGLRPHAAVERGGAVVGIEVPPGAPWRGQDLDEGDVIFFSALTIHRALPNRTADRLRVSVDYRYRPPRTD